MINFLLHKTKTGNHYNWKAETREWSSFCAWKITQIINELINRLILCFSPLIFGVLVQQEVCEVRAVLSRETLSCLIMFEHWVSVQFVTRWCKKPAGEHSRCVTVRLWLRAHFSPGCIYLSLLFPLLLPSQFSPFINPLLFKHPSSFF